MHQPLDRAHGVVANWIVALGGIADELTRIGHELTRDRVGGIVWPDELGQRRGKGNGVTPGDRLELLKPFGPGQPGFDKILGAGQAARLEARRHTAFTMRESKARALARSATSLASSGPVTGTAAAAQGGGGLA